MGNSHILLSVFAVAFTVVPIWLMLKAANKRNRTLKSALDLAIKENNNTSVHQVLWSNKIMALDKNNKLYYLTADEDNEVNNKLVFDLNSYSNVQLRINKKEIYRSDESGKMEIKSIDMNLIPNRKENVVTLNLYDSSVDDILDYGHHLEVGKKWEKLLMKNKISA